VGSEVYEYDGVLNSLAPIPGDSIFTIYPAVFSFSRACFYACFMCFKARLVRGFCNFFGGFLKFANKLRIFPVHPLHLRLEFFENLKG
jgi:hypothetical protein